MPAKVRLPQSIELDKGEISLLRRLARAPLNQLVTQRRIVIRALRRRGMTPAEIGQWLKITRTEVLEQIAAAGAGQQGGGVSDSQPEPPGRDTVDLKRDTFQPLGISDAERGAS